MDKIGRVLCVLEAKRADLAPYDATEQARSRSRLEEARLQWRLHRKELNRPRLNHEDWEY